MHTYNRTIIIGRLGADPKLNTKSKHEVVTFHLSNTTFRDGEEVVQWHKIVAFNKQARVCYEHLRKGDLCCIEGRLECELLDNGSYKQTIIAERVTFLSHRKEQAND